MHLIDNGPPYCSNCGKSLGIDFNKFCTHCGTAQREGEKNINPVVQPVNPERWSRIVKWVCKRCGYKIHSKIRQCPVCKGVNRDIKFIRYAHKKSIWDQCECIIYCILPLFFSLPILILIIIGGL